MMSPTEYQSIPDETDVHKVLVILNIAVIAYVATAMRMKIKRLNNRRTWTRVIVKRRAQVGHKIYRYIYIEDIYIYIHISDGNN